MTPLHTLPNHKLWRTSRDTSLLAVETGYNPNQHHSHIHLRMEQWFPCAALELGPTPGSTCVILRVSPHETIHLTRWVSGCARKESYDVLPDFTLRHSPAAGGLLDRSGGFQEFRSKPLGIKEVDLEFLFAQEWPDWLTPTLEAQLQHWRRHHAEHYYHYSPWEMGRDDLWRCVKANPSQALRRFGPMLSRSQREICCRNAPRAAAAHALGSLDPFTRRRAIDDYPEEILRNSSIHLTDPELIALAARHPLSVFRCYRCMPPRQMALVLSTALNQRRGYSFEPAYLREEFLLKSLVEFPAEWLAGSGGSFDRIFNSWTDRLGWRTNGKDMMAIRREPPFTFFQQCPSHARSS